MSEKLGDRSLPKEVFKIVEDQLVVGRSSGPGKAFEETRLKFSDVSDDEIRNAIHALMVAQILVFTLDGTFRIIGSLENLPSHMT